MGRRNFSRREPQFYKRLFQSNIQGQYGSKYTTFPVSIVNTKETGEIENHPKAPLVEYHKSASNSYCFSSLASTLTAPGENNATRAIAIRIV